MDGPVPKETREPAPLADASVYMVEVRAVDWERLAEFYGTTLGLPRRMMDAQAGFAMFGKREPFVAVVRKPGAAARGARVVIDFTVGDLDGALAELSRRGVSILSPAKPSPEGYRIARIADPEGNEIHLFEWTSPSAGPV